MHEMVDAKLTMNILASVSSRHPSKARTSQEMSVDQVCLDITLCEGMHRHIPMPIHCLLAFGNQVFDTLLKILEHGFVVTNENGVALTRHVYDRTTREDATLL